MVTMVFGNMSMEYVPIKENGKVVGVTLTIKFNKSPPRSQSGKTLIDFSTRGNQSLDLEGLRVMVGLNIYHYP